MFNSGYKKGTLAVLEQTTNKYQVQFDSTVEDITSLHNRRISSVELIKKVESFINSLVNTPKEFEKFSSEIKVNRQRFETEVLNLEIESKKAAKVSGGLAGAGAAAGVGVAAFGPAAAMAIATTFGTASTGTAIVTLSGAAASKAALAWIGGGALTAGGGGIVAGNAFLALAGPVGWGIGGVALAGSGLLANSKNKKIAKKAEEQTKLVKIEINNLLKVQAKVKSVSDQTLNISKNIKILVDDIVSVGINDYTKCNETQKEELKTLLNATRSLSSKLCEKLI